MFKTVASILLSSFLVFSCATKRVKLERSKLSYSYNRLKLLDVDEMTDIIQQKMNDYKKNQDTEFLNDAITIGLSRPNTDNILEKLMLNIRYSLDSNDLWEESVEIIVEKAIFALKNETTSASDQVTYAILLQNLIVEFKPEFHRLDISPRFERNIIEKIADADLIVSDVARKEASLNLLGRPPLPSETARALLQELQESKSINSPKK